LPSPTSSAEKPVLPLYWGRNGNWESIPDPYPLPLSTFHNLLVLWKGKPRGLSAYKTRGLLGDIWVPFMERILGLGGVISASSN